MRRHLWTSQVERAHTIINMCSSILSTGTQVTGLTPGETPAFKSRARFSRISTLVEPFAQELTQFEQPALSVRVEESVSEVVAVVLGDLERLVLDALVQVLESK